jgi:hypothetical protein
MAFTRSGDFWYATGLGPEFDLVQQSGVDPTTGRYIYSNYDVWGTGGKEQMDLAKALYDAYGQVGGANVPNPRNYTPPYNPEQLFGVGAPPALPGVGGTETQNIAAVTEAASKARGEASKSFQEQLTQGQAAAGEIAAAKGKTGGTGAENILKGITEESQANLQALINKITGVETKAQADVANLGQLNQADIDRYRTEISGLAAQNQGLFNTAYQDAFDQAVNVLEGTRSLYEPYNQQLQPLVEQKQGLLDQIMGAYQGSNFTSPLLQGESEEGKTYYNPQAVPGTSDFMSALQGLNLPQAPSLGELSGQVTAQTPEYTPFSSIGIPNYQSADLNPYVSQFEQFQLDPIRSLSGALNAADPTADRGRGQYNIPGYQQAGNTPADQDFMAALLAIQQQSGGLFGGGGFF